VTAEPSPESSPADRDQTGHGAVVQAHESELDTGGLIYGTVVSAAALAVGAGRGDTAGGMIETMLSTLIIYWMAHVYTATVRGRRPGVPRH